MLKYAQPDFYHFTEDSTKLARFVIEKYKNDFSQVNVLDLCAGSGVIGLEILQGLPQLKSSYFIEAQEEFIPILTANIKTFGFDKIGQIFHNDFKKLDELTYSGIIVCNPPYYELNSGKLPTNVNRQRCHFMSKEERDRLLEILRRAINCSIYILFPLEIDRLYPDLNLVETVNEKVGIYFLST